ncbi:5-deoxy-glucuronate isomerase [Agromyces mediolanus]|uniref:5-deoxy-glucuronate isomerase n=1 Tax=Agromyces mediolanus TaxID=41986 RepID=UPI001E4EE6C8|nr:5-deoxy-glucuronate isomerase [Agromyces mediolanus]MCD1570598.1 5-deoxy-glucuronate isomerase [Agromyces mediolanus]
MSARWLHRRGELADGPWEAVVDDRVEGWSWTGLRVAELAADAALALPAGGLERLVVPLAGAFALELEHADGRREHLELRGRASVFAGPSDVAYLGVGTAATLSGSGRVAVAEAPSDERHPSRRISAEEVPVELRGAGRSSRQVHNFGTPEALAAGRFIVCEVITPAENWSSYPPHKHDEHVPGAESQLEEIYYFEAAVTRGAEAPAGARPFGLFSTSSSPAGDIEIEGRVGTGDIALVPFGYHGPAVAAPGYDLYYLNVMAGPGPERAWRISDDPAHAWVRDSWAGQELDPRLPYLAPASEGARP